MYNVKYQSHSASQTWSSYGSYTFEQSALNTASRILVNTTGANIDSNSHVIWSS